MNTGSTSGNESGCETGTRGPATSAVGTRNRHWMVGRVETPAGPVPRAATHWTRRDWIGAVGVRWNIGRMRYAVEPGLYAVGRPTAESPVLLSANYKLSFDILRQSLNGLDAWVLVVDTKGINVWCAAGKGSFGTEEVAHRVAAAEVTRVVRHRTLVLPQLAAPGVAAHEVTRRTGFKIVYGPVRAADIPAFLRDGMRATPSMRRVRFDLADRLKVIPVELAQVLPRVLAVGLVLAVLGGIGLHGYRLTSARHTLIEIAWPLVITVVAGALLTPILLPWLPGRALALKGGVCGLATALLWETWERVGSTGIRAWNQATGEVLAVVAGASFVALTFTGATPYTSVSGVKRELRLAVPLQIALAVAGVGLWLAARMRQ